MKKLIPLLLPILASFLLAPLTAAKEAKAVILDDENFERLTQAAAGGDTGDWLILFCEMQRFKDKCDPLVPLWDELARDLSGKALTVAHVDV